MPKLSQQTHITICGQLQKVDPIWDEAGQRLYSKTDNHRHLVYSKALSLLFVIIFFFLKFGRHQIDTAFIICWPNSPFKSSHNATNYSRPLANFDFFFPLTRCAFSFFLCLEFIHIGYCPCWSRRVFLFRLLSTSILQSSEKERYL
uniref:Uncharacterized protein n=1 Tax=Accipiter nisus TaxID=211598 RepID=A0A8B9NDC1_9AVES